MPKIKINKKISIFSIQDRDLFTTLLQSLGKSEISRSLPSRSTSKAHFTVAARRRPPPPPPPRGARTAFIPFLLPFFPSGPSYPRNDCCLIDNGVGASDGRGRALPVPDRLEPERLMRFEIEEKVKRNNGRLSDQSA